MAFSYLTWDKLSAEANTDVRKLWSYVSTADSLATISGSGYFDSVANKLSIGDDILIGGSDGYDRVRVSAVSPNVTVTTEPDVAAGSITNNEVSASAAIAFSKLAALTDGNLLVGSAANVPTSVAMSGDVTIVNSGATTLGTVVSGAKVATYADEDTAPGVPVLHVFNMAAGATATRTIATTRKIKVIDAWAVLKGAGTTSDTVQVKNAAGTAITDAMDCSGSDKAIVRAGEIDDANDEVAAAANLQCTITDGGGSDVPAIDVFVLCNVIA